ncbi:tyrosine-type recombinase/integrase [Acidithiobacillus ferridurans]|uniref:tyrosine-type recombinase/integrase n=1 Tax=Acidithiobacillus ferridurans TaxID=1232575 RepID=UPI001C071863|nr:site-specific integrase [Acidithiobacillus ferridurans]MBU2734109.1 site-specific integrase [Acidithiobacillus ferridurans]
MAYIEKREGKTGTTYRAQIKRKGAPILSKTFKRKTDAEAWAKKQEVAMIEGEHFPERAAQRHTFSEAAKTYKAEHLKGLADPANREMHVDWWTERLGRLRLSGVTPEIINEHLKVLSDERLRNGKTRAASTINHYRIAVTHVLKMARKWGWTGTLQTDRVTRVKIDNARVRYLDDDELPRLLEAVKHHPDLNLVVLLALGTGARAGELLSLTWRQVDLKKRQILLTKTKNGDMRTLPIPAQALPLLAARVRRLDTTLIFPSHRHPQKPVDLRRPWTEALAAARITDFHFHDLRHSAASYLVQQGVSLVAVAALLGHRTLQMTKRYSHLAPEHLAELGSKLDEKLGGAR